MATKTAGGRISSRIALTLEAQSALEVGDPVSITGPYECDKADSGDTFVGTVSVANVKRQGATYPVANVPGDVTVEAKGSYVAAVTAGDAITAGAEVFVSAAGAYVGAAGATGVGAAVGIALTTAAAAAKADVLFY